MLNCNGVVFDTISNEMMVNFNIFCAGRKDRIINQRNGGDVVSKERCGFCCRNVMLPK